MSESMGEGAKALSPKPTVDEVMGNNYDLVSYCRPDCPYCLGRGKERWLVERITDSEGEVCEQFALGPCRNIKHRIEQRIQPKSSKSS